MTGENFLFSLNVETWISKFKKLNFLSVEPTQLWLDGILGYFLANVSLLKWILLSSASALYKKSDLCIL